MNAILFLFFIIFILIILRLTIYLLYEYLYQNIDNNYKLLLNKLDVKKLKRYEKCPSGCSKGICINKNYCSITDMLENRCCNFDVQCHHCVDLDGEYYKYPNNYYDHKKQEVNLQNDKIKLKNKQIDEINKVINKIK